MKKSKKSKRVDKQMDKIMQLHSVIKSYGEDKLRAEIYSAILRRWLHELCEFDIFLIRVKAKNIRKRFKKVIDIVGGDVGSI